MEDGERVTSALESKIQRTPTSLVQSVFSTEMPLAILNTSARKKTSKLVDWLRSDRIHTSDQSKCVAKFSAQRRPRSMWRRWERSLTPTISSMSARRTTRRKLRRKRFHKTDWHLRRHFYASQN